MIKVELQLSEEVAGWLAQQPEGGSKLVETLVKQRMAGPKPWGQKALKRVAEVLREAKLEIVEQLTQEFWEEAEAAPTVSAETEQQLKELAARDADLGARAKALVRYPQLIDAVFRELVSIERAEMMAEEADARG